MSSEPKPRHGRAANVTATVLCHNSIDSLIEVLEAVSMQSVTPSRVVVVDNGSSDGTKEHLGSLSWIEAVRLDENQGVGAGHNRAIEIALSDPECDYVWLLEHDSVPARSCLEELMRAVTRLKAGDEEIGALMPRRARRDELGSLPAAQGLRSGTIMTFNGVLLPRSTVEAVGPLREDFFVGLEDSEYADRIRVNGLPIYEVDSSLLTHENKGMRRRGIAPSVGRSYYSIRNSVFLEVYLRHRPGSIARTLIRALGGSLRTLAAEDDKVARVCARLVATYDGLAKRLGRRRYWFLS